MFHNGYYDYNLAVCFATLAFSNEEGKVSWGEIQRATTSAAQKKRKVKGNSKLAFILLQIQQGSCSSQFDLELQSKCFKRWN